MLCVTTRVHVLQSNPTPRASNGGSKGNNIYLKSKVIPEEKIFYKKEMTLQDPPQISKIVISDSSKYTELERKIDSITNGLSKPYFKKILKEVIKKEF